jgi:F-type H+-transporting ATPase subunit delta
MKSSKLAQREARQLFRGCMAGGVLDENLVRKTVTLLLEDKPRRYIVILGQFQRLIKLELDRRATLVESAAPLGDDFQARVRDTLTRVYGAGLSFSFNQNPGLLGGLRIKVGSDVYDGSVRARLAALEQSF